MSTPELTTILGRRDDSPPSATGAGVPPEVALAIQRRQSEGEPEVWPDLMSAIENYWLSIVSLTQISPKLYLNEGPPNPTYPFATYSNPGEVPKMNTGKGYWENKVINFAIYSMDDYQLITYGDWLTNAFDPLNDSKDLHFRNGYLMGFRRTGGGLLRMPNQVKGRYVWRQSYTYLVTVGRTQARR